jgi:hypothetical protein
MTHVLVVAARNTRSAAAHERLVPHCVRAAEMPGDNVVVLLADAYQFEL